MSLIGFDGFDHYAGNSDFVTRQGNLTWSNGGSGVTSFTSSTRFGVGKAANASNLGYAIGNTYVLMSTGYIGAAVKATPGIFGGLVAITAIDSFHNVQHAEGGFDSSNGAAYIKDKNGTVVSTGTVGAIPSNTWGYLEVRFTIGHAGVGIVTIRWNGINVLQNTTADFWNTTSGGTQSFNRFELAPKGLNMSAVFDDVYVNDNNTDAGTFPNNTFNGDVSVTPLYAIANNSVTWTPLSGTNYQMINDVTFNGDTTYNSTAAASSEDLFSFQSVPAYISGVIAVQLVGAFREDAVGVRTLSQHLKSSGSDVTGASRVLNTGYAYWSDFWTLDPATGINWSLTGVNNALAGYSLDT